MVKVGGIKKGGTPLFPAGIFWGFSDFFLSLLSPPDELCPLRQRGGLDSGFHSVDSGTKRWSGNEVNFGAFWGRFLGCPPSCSLTPHLWYRFSPRMNPRSHPGTSGRHGTGQVRGWDPPNSPLGLSQISGCPPLCHPHFPTGGDSDPEQLEEEPSPEVMPHPQILSEPPPNQVLGVPPPPQNSGFPHLLSPRSSRDGAPEVKAPRVSGEGFGEALGGSSGRIFWGSDPPFPCRGGPTWRRRPKNLEVWRERERDRSRDRYWDFGMGNWGFWGWELGLRFWIWGLGL